jgi:bifunctional non-homologous end joining protein LigD
VRLPVVATQSVGNVDAALARARPAAGRGRLRLGNLDKVYWPAQGYTKGDLLAYYDQVAPYLVPHLVDRPVHMLRYPDGIEGEAFYQRQAPEHLPDWFETLEVQDESRGQRDRHMIIGSREALLTLVNLGSIDIHPWMSRRQSLDSPDYTVIDLDPKSAPFGNVVKVARVVGRILRGIGVEPHLKTSGKTGIHIYLPLRRGYTYDHSRMFAEGIARAVCREIGDLATVERGMGARGGKVYVDFLQSRRGQTVVPPYAVRPVAEASVSTPLTWDELDGDLHPSHFTLHDVIERLESRGDLFLPVLGEGEDLLPAIAALERYLEG